jgi:hypothetical protein
VADKKKSTDIEFEPDAWERFERAVKIVAKSPPQHRTKKTAESMTPKKGKTQPGTKASKEK